MIFDGQSSTFFTFLFEKVGIEKVKELVQAINNEDVEARDFIARPDMLGDDYGNIEEEWIGWVQDLKPVPPSFPTGVPQAKAGN